MNEDTVMDYVGASDLYDVPSPTGNQFYSKWNCDQHDFVGWVPSIPTRTIASWYPLTTDVISMINVLEREARASAPVISEDDYNQVMTEVHYVRTFAERTLWRCAGLDD